MFEMRRAWPRLLAAAAGLAAMAVGTAQAAEGASFEGIVIGTYQHIGPSTIGGSPVEDEASAAIDLGLSLPLAGGTLEIEVKGGTTPRDRGVTSVLPEANATVGESLDGEDRGRIIPWQLFYRHPVAGGSLALGLLDPAGWLDGNEVANDEFTQFMGATFVNNPSIDLPSASAGLAYDLGLGQGWGLSFLVANAHGVEPRYRQAFELGEQGHGWFAAVQAQWTGAALSANAGVWFNTRHEDEDGDGIDDGRLSDTYGRGLYGNLSGPLGAGQWNLRAGWADPDVETTAGFLALAYARPVGTSVLGVAVGRTFASDRLPTAHADLQQAEAYVRFPVAKGVQITADLQHITHSGFDPDKSGTWVPGARLSWAF